MKVLMTVEEIARVAHNVNRAYCQAIGDTAALSWEDAPDWQKKSAIAGVEKHLDAPLTPEQSHHAWVMYKLADGWTYGPMKSAENKTHPCMVPYSLLPAEQKVKDYLFAAVVESLRDIY